ncbi:MAG: ribose 5-phosphate isomerase B [Acidobacteriota bacterium]
MSSSSSSDAEARVRGLVQRALEEVLDGAGGASSQSLAAQGAARSSSAGGSSLAEKSIAIGADHGGFALKERLGTLLRDRGWQVSDCGTFSTASCDYPDFAHEVAKRVAARQCRWGVVVDGAGIGSAMVANKVPGVRAALCYDLSSARNSREHNHANVLTLGAGLVGPALAEQILLTWLETPWGEGRHARRAGMISAVEASYSRPGS